MCSRKCKYEKEVTTMTDYDKINNMLYEIKKEINNILHDENNYITVHSGKRELNESADGKFVGLHIAEQIIIKERDAEY